MTGTREKVRAIFLVAIMALSVVAMGAVFAGAAAASPDQIDEGEGVVIADSADANEPDQTHVYTVNTSDELDGELHGENAYINISAEETDLSTLEDSAGIDSADINIWVDGDAVTDETTDVNWNDEDDQLEIQLEDTSNQNLDGNDVITIELEEIDNPGTSDSIDIEIQDSDETVNNFDDLELAIGDDAPIHVNDDEEYHSVLSSVTVAEDSTIEITDTVHNVDYTGALDIDNTLTIDQDNVEIVSDGEAIYTSADTVLESDDDEEGITVSGVTFQGIEGASSPGTVLDTTDDDPVDLTVEDNQFYDFDHEVLNLDVAGDLTVSENHFEGNDGDAITVNAAAVGDGDTVYIGYNHIELDDDNGIIVERVDESEATLTIESDEDNPIVGAGSADAVQLATDESIESDVEISGLNITDATTGIELAESFDMGGDILIEEIIVDNVDTAINSADQNIESDLTVADLEVTDADNGIVLATVNGDVEFENLEFDGVDAVVDATDLTSNVHVDGLAFNDSAYTGDNAVAITTSDTESAQFHDLEATNVSATDIDDVVAISVDEVEDVAIDGVVFEDVDDLDDYALTVSGLDDANSDDLSVSNVDATDVDGDVLELETDARYTDVSNVNLEGVEDGITVADVEDDRSTVELNVWNVVANDTATVVNVDTGANGDDAGEYSVDISDVDANNASADAIVVNGDHIDVLDIDADVADSDANAVTLTSVDADADVAVVVDVDDVDGHGVEIGTDAESIDISESTFAEVGGDSVHLDSGFDGTLSIENVDFESNDGDSLNVASTGADAVVSATESNFLNESAVVVASGADLEELNVSSNYWADETGPEYTYDGAVEHYGLGGAITIDAGGVDAEDVELTPFVDEDGDAVIAFTGEIEDHEGSPVADKEAEITFTNQAGETGTFVFDETGTDGEYVAVTGATGLFDTYASADGHADSDEREAFIPSDVYVASGVDFTMGEGGDLEGVVHGADGEPADLTDVELIDADTDEVITTFDTDADGAYDDVTFSPGEYSLQANHSDHALSSVVDVTIEEGEVTEQNFTLGGQLNATVFTPDGDELNDSTVELIDADTDEVLETVSTDENGTFETALAADDYSLQVDNASYDPSDAADVTIEDGETTEQNFTLAEDTTATLTATVEDEDGDALEETEVTFTADDVDFEKTVETDSNGEVTLEVPSGTYQLTASAEDVGEDTRTVDIRTSESLSLTFSLEEVDDDEKTVDDYKDGDGNVTTDLLRDAIDDWRGDTIDTGLLRDVIDEWRSA